MKTFREIQIFADENNKEALKYKDALELELKKREALFAPYPDKKKIELVIALGGDGTMFKAVHEFDFGPVFLGINLGHRGYLMNGGDPSDVADRILEGRFKTHKFPLLEIDVAGRGKYFAMNDVYIKSNDTGESCRTNVAIDGVEIADRILGDGILICSALGSTGYFVPAGGSALYPKLPVIGLVSMICNFPVKLAPMIFPRRSRVEITILSPPEEVRGWYDGKNELPHFCDSQKIIIRSGKRRVSLAFWEEENFTERLIRRITRTPEVRHADN